MQFSFSAAKDAASPMRSARPATRWRCGHRVEWNRSTSPRRRQSCYRGVSMAGKLVIVGTPIGNLSDMSSRAVEALKSADIILCEDTRHTRKLLLHFGIET